MQDVFEKIKERLKELGWVFGTYYYDGTEVNKQSRKSVPYDDVIEIVNQVAEEYVPEINVGENEEFCEWKREVYYDKCPHEEGLFKRVHYDETVERAFKYCPYCGKKIKVVE